ncbi:LmeA family phospholipid-binding protein [Microbacterium sp. bgisy207]|uniref:LmeA family phospholipid-binding protein n=1 Tax=Microbacterium sp. bgisy207 TaxID=3413800 RepID=UPI003EC04F98
MTDAEHPTDPLPDLRAGWVLAVPEEPKKRRRVWPWLVAAAAVVIVVVVAVVIVETVVRSNIESGIASQVRTGLELPADQPVDVSIEGPLTLQLLTGSLDDLRLSSDDVPLGPTTADVEVTLRGVSTTAPYTVGVGAATVTLDQSQVAALTDSVAQIDILELALEDPAIVVGTELSLFGFGIPVSLSLVPSAQAGELVLRPESLQVSGLAVTADGVRRQFGTIADPILQDWQICVAQYLPAGATLTAASVTDDHLVATFDIDGRMLDDATLQQNGTC